MPRPHKWRSVCRMPSVCVFSPNPGTESPAETIVMTVDEYETIRLIDLLDFSQEECGAYMKIARTTAQQIYASARKKISLALVEGRTLKISGGDYRLCEGGEGHPTCCGCHKHAHHDCCDRQSADEQSDQPKQTHTETKLE